jgi:cellobiose phosphorylase
VKRASKYNDGAAIIRAFELSWTQGKVESMYLNLKRRDIEIFQEMLSHIIHISPLRRKREGTIKHNTRGQSGLWPYGISGDVPIVLVSVGKYEELGIVYQLLKAHEYWMSKGFKVDLVILNTEEVGYIQDFQQIKIDDTIQPRRLYAG